MTGPTGADQQRPGQLDVNEALAAQRELYAEQAERARVARQVAEILGDEQPKPPRPPG